MGAKLEPLNILKIKDGRQDGVKMAEKCNFKIVLGFIQNTSRTLALRVYVVKECTLNIFKFNFISYSKAEK